MRTTRISSKNRRHFSLRMPIRQGKYRPDRTKLSAAMAVSTARQRGLCRAYRRFAADSGSTGRHAIARQTGTVCDLRGLPVAEQWCASESLGGLIFGIRLMNEFPGRGFLSTFAVDKYVCHFGKTGLSRACTRIFLILIIFCAIQISVFIHIDNKHPAPGARMDSKRGASGVRHCG